MPPLPIWTLTASGISGGSEGQKLAGCHIIVNNAGNAYEFTAPNISEVLASTTGNVLPLPPFTFPPFIYRGLEWTIGILKLPIGAPATGTWSTSAESGNFVAQAGEALAGDEAASSAGAD